MKSLTRCVLPALALLAAGGSACAAGNGAPDYVLIHVAGNWSGYGQLLDASPWKMIETVYGKTAADAIRKTSFSNDTGFPLARE